MTTMIKVPKFLQHKPTRVHKPYSVSDQNMVEICTENLLPPLHVISHKLLQNIGACYLNVSILLAMTVLNMYFFRYIVQMLEKKL